MKTLITYLLLLICFASCTASKHSSANRVGLVILKNYVINTRAVFTNDTTYMVVTNEERLTNNFTYGDAEQKPDFNGQQVMAIVIKRTPVQSAIQFEQADITGSTMNVYATTCIAGTNNCELTSLAIATVPKSGSVKRVRFFVNSVLRATVPV